MDSKYIVKIMQKFDVVLKNAYEGLYYFKGERLELHLVEPHSGTDYKYYLRANYGKGVRKKYEAKFNIEDFDKVIKRVEKLMEPG